MEKNNVRVSDAVLAAMREAAQGEDVNGLFEIAAQRLLAHRRLDDLASRGRKYAQALGRRPSDTVRLVRESRNEQRGW
jgi:hypothetical protein